MRSRYNTFSPEIRALYATLAETKKIFYKEAECHRNIRKLTDYLREKNISNLDKNLLVLYISIRNGNVTYGNGKSYNFHLVSLYYDEDNSNQWYILDYDAENNLHHSINEPLLATDYLRNAFGIINNQPSFLLARLKYALENHNSYILRDIPEFIVFNLKEWESYDDDFISMLTYFYRFSVSVQGTACILQKS